MLLTRAELKRLRIRFRDVQGQHDNWSDFVARAQHTHTLKAVAEWMSQKCDVESHSRYRNGRASCPLCLANLIICGIEGKMPGEE